MSLSPWILSPLVWFLLPGYAIAPARLRRPLHCARVLGISFLVTSGLSLALAFIGRFNAKLVTVLLLIFLPAAIWRLWKLAGNAGGRGKAGALFHEAIPPLLLAIVVTLLPAFSSFKLQIAPGQPLQGACDAGVYAAAARNLETTGRFDWKAHDLLPPEARARALSIRTTPYHYPWRETWPGIVQVGGRFAPQFFPLYPVWLSLFGSAFGGHAIFCLNLLALALALFFLSVLARSFLPWRYARLSLLVPALDPGVVYFLDHPLSEIFLAFVFTAMLAFLVYGFRYRIRSLLILSACFLAAGMATKYMAWFLLVPLAMLWVLADQKGWLARCFGVPLLAAAVFPAACLALWNYPHFLNHFMPRERLVQAAGFALVLVLAWGLSRAKTVQHRLSPAVGALFTVAVLVFLFVLPGPAERGEENVLPELAWYTGWGWLALAFIGCWVLLYRKGRDAKPVLIFFFMMLAVAFAGTADNPLHPFAFRRHIPVLVPLIGLLSAVGLHWLRRLGTIMVSGIVLLAVAPPLVLGTAMMTAGEGKGFLPLLTRVSEELPDPPVYALDDADWLASQAQLLKGKRVYPLHMGDAEGLDAYQAFARGGGSVKVLTGQVLPYDNLLEWSGGIQHLRPERNRRPSVIESRQVRLFLYGIPLEKTRVGGRLEVGGDDFGRVAGFWAPERDGERPFRWSRQWCHFILETQGRLVLAMNASGHPENPVPFRIYLGKGLIAESFATPGWKEYAFDLPPAGRKGMVTFSLVTHSFQPLPDARDLGLMVSEIRTH